MCKVGNFDRNKGVYIGRAGHGEDGLLGNPVRMGAVCEVCGQVHTEKGSTLKCYEHLLRNSEQMQAVIKARVKVGDTLRCPGRCRPEHCHGSVIARFVNNGYQL